MSLFDFAELYGDDVAIDPSKLVAMPTMDARTYALRQLRAFLCAIEFRRKGAVGDDTGIPFQLSESQVQIEQPDDVKDAPLPSIAVIPGRAQNVQTNLGPAEIAEETLHRFGRWTALLATGSHEEAIQLECRASKKAERWALVAALKKVFRLGKKSGSIRLTLPEYFDQVATFALDESQYVDGDEVALNRRRAFLQLRLSVPEVQLVNVQLMRPSARVDLLDGRLDPSLESVTDAQLGQFEPE